MREEIGKERDSRERGREREIDTEIVKYIQGVFYIDR